MPHNIKEGDRLLYFQIGLSVTLAVALLVVNYETPKKEYVSHQTEVIGLEVEKVRADTTDLVLPPEIKKTKKN